MKLTKPILGAACLALSVALGTGAHATTAVQIERIYAHTNATHKVSAGNVLPWTFAMDCQPYYAAFIVAGPGEASSSETLATGNNAGNTFVSPSAPMAHQRLPTA